MSDKADKIKNLIDDLCERAKIDINQHIICEQKNRRYKNFHVLTVSLISIFTGSVLFFILQDKASNFTTLLGSVLSFIAASCATINAHFKYPENEAGHKLTVKRLDLYIISCEQTVNKFNANLISESEFELLYKKHSDEYIDIKKSGETISKVGNQKHNRYLNYSKSNN